MEVVELNRDLRIVAQSIRRELESTRNEENILVSTGFDKFRARFYIRDKTEFVSISIDFEAGLIPSIRASIKKKGNPVAERLVSLNLKNKYDKITEEQLASIILIIKVIVNLIEGDWMSESEDYYLKAHLLDIEKFYSMEFNDKVVNDEIVISFEKTLRAVMWDSLRRREDKGILHPDQNLSVLLKDSDKRDLTVTIPRELFNKLTLGDPSLQENSLPEIIQLVINEHISNKNKQSNSMKNIDSDFRKSDK